MLMCACHACLSRIPHAYTHAACLCCCDLTTFQLTWARAAKHANRSAAARIHHMPLIPPATLCAGLPCCADGRRADRQPKPL
jgi:hypothetical protein